MFTGGTAGSTSGGIKIVRLLLITKNNRQELRRLIHPNAYLPVRLDKIVFLRIQFIIFWYSLHYILL